MAQRQAGQVVQRKGIIRRNGRESRIGDHRRRACAGFLGGLEEQHGAAPRRPCPREQAREAHNNRHMPVMATEMPGARHGRAMRGRAGLGDGQGVQLAAKEHGGARCRALVYGGDAMPAQPGEQVIGGAWAKGVGDAVGGLTLRPRYLGVAVEPAAQRGEIGDVGMGEGHGAIMLISAQKKRAARGAALLKRSWQVVRCCLRSSFAARPWGRRRRGWRRPRHS
jgi:hypothetical protein